MSKPRGRPFQPGNTLGRGRPRGSRNRPGSPIKQLLDEYSVPVARKCIAMALKENPSAMRICMEQISPARREAVIQMNLPPIRTATDVDKAAEKVTQAIRRGDLTPSELEAMMKILDIRSRVIERAEFERRIEEVEQNEAAKTSRSKAPK